MGSLELRFVLLANSLSYLPERERIYGSYGKVPFSILVRLHVHRMVHEIFNHVLSPVNPVDSSVPGASWRFPDTILIMESI